MDEYDPGQKLENSLLMCFWVTLQTTQHEKHSIFHTSCSYKTPKYHYCFHNLCLFITSAHIPYMLFQHVNELDDSAFSQTLRYITEHCYWYFEFQQSLLTRCSKPSFSPVHLKLHLLDLLFSASPIYHQFSLILNKKKNLIWLPWWYFTKLFLICICICIKVFVRPTVHVHAHEFVSLQYSMCICK